jgi:hypothetical protein
VRGDTITGTATLLLPPHEQSNLVELPWRAVRVAKSNYFEATGVDVK